MALSTLTWAQTDYTSTGQTAPTDAQVIAALDTASANLTKWVKVSSTADYLELQSPSVDGHKMNVIISVNPGNNAYCLSPDTQAAAVWIGLAPDAGTLGTWNSATPYGAERWSKYTRCCVTAKAESVYFVETDESIGVFFRDDSLDRFYGALVGALWEPGTNQAEADGRVYGIISTGSRVISPSFWNSASEFMTYSNSSGYSHTYCFRPASPTTIDPILKMDSTRANGDPAMFQDGNGNDNGLPVFYCSNQNPYYFIGSLRQMYYGAERAARATLSNGFAFAGNSVGTADALLLLNE